MQLPDLIRKAEKIEQIFAGIPSLQDRIQQLHALETKIELHYATEPDFEAYGRVLASLSNVNQLLHSLRFAAVYGREALLEKKVQDMLSAESELDRVIKYAKQVALQEVFQEAQQITEIIVTLQDGAGHKQLDTPRKSLCEAYASFAKSKGLHFEIIEVSERSLCTRIKGDYAYAYFQSEIGTHRFVQLSKGKRQTGYISVTVEPYQNQETLSFCELDLHYEFLAATGPGGQHANRAHTAVRITHLPTGICAVSRTRSQQSNISSAKEVLAARVNLHHTEQERTNTSRLQTPSRGTHFRTYQLVLDQHVIDHSTAVRSTPARFFQGELDPFVFGHYQIDASLF